MSTPGTGLAAVLEIRRGSYFGTLARLDAIASGLVLEADGSMPAPALRRACSERAALMREAIARVVEQKRAQRAQGGAAT